MSTSEGTEPASFLDNEHRNNEFDDYDLVPEYFLKGEDSVSSISIHPKWRKTPRTTADFSESKSKISSCKDSDYEAWLENYYQNLYQEQTKQSFSEKKVDTCDLPDKKPQNVLTSLFQSAEKDIWSFSTKYWGPKDARRHWPLRQRAGEYMFLPSIHPHLNLRSRYGRFHSLLNSAAAIPECVHRKVVCSNFKKTLQNLKYFEPQLQKIMICDTLCNLKWFDCMSKAMATKILCRFLRSQYNMEKVYFENMSFERLEGIILLCSLSRQAGDFVKELHLWKMFGFGQCPVLLNDLSKKGEILPTTKNERFFSKIHYLQVINNFSNLTHLSINYAYLANRKGDALLYLRCITLGCLKELRFLCTKEERPLLTNPGYGTGGWKIADGVWRRILDWCPLLRVSFVFLNMPQYENVIVFLSKSIPVSYVYLSSGIDFNFEVPWDIDSTLLELRNWYASTLGEETFQISKEEKENRIILAFNKLAECFLETLCLHLWHHRDLLDFVIRCKILEEFPNLLNFEFIGILEDVETLEEFCCKLSKGIYKLKMLLFWVEEEYTNQKKLSLTRNRVAEIRSKYRKKFLLIDIDADLQTYIPPYVHYIIKDDAVVLQGSFGQLWNILEERLGFTSEYIIESYNTGVLNFQNKRRDVLLRPSVMSSDDVDEFDFTFPIGNTWYELYLKDSDEINSSNSYVKNWSMGIWIFTGFMIFLFTLLMYLMLHLSEKFLLRDIYVVPTSERSFHLVQNLAFESAAFYLPRNWRKMKKRCQILKSRNDRSLGNCFIAAISVFCSQGVYMHTSVISLRLSMLSFLIFGMIMYNSYSALLVSQLTLGERFLPFDTLEEIPLKAKQYSLCVRSESYPFLYFTVNNSVRELKDKWKKIINRKPCPEDGILSLEEMCQPYVAFLEAPAVMEALFLGNDKCKMANLRGRYFSVDFSLLILKGFEENAKRELNNEVLKYREVGILSYLEKKWISHTKVISGTQKQKLQVTFEHIKGILLVYVCCLGFCCSLFCLEILFYLKKQRKFF